MSLVTFFFGELIISSSLQGQVLLNGIPVSGAVITRDCYWTWGDEKVNHQVISDAQGKFQFPEVVRKSFWGSWLPHEPVIKIDVAVQYQGKTHKAFITNKSNYERFGEFENRTAHALICNLEREPQRNEQHDAYGISELVPAQTN